MSLETRLCGRLLHAFFPLRTRSGGSLSLDGKVRGQRMTTDMSRIALIRPLVSGMSFILPHSLLCACPALFFLSDTTTVFLLARHIDWQETATWSRQSQCQDGSKANREHTAYRCMCSVVNMMLAWNECPYSSNSVFV